MIPTFFQNLPIWKQLTSPRTGYIEGLNARQVGETAVLLGGGRAKKDDLIDHSVGIVLHNKVGSFVKEGEPLFTVYAARRKSLDDAIEVLLAAYTWSEHYVEPLPLFYGMIS
jgi:pyrimidine-nucleoside phosphorylase